MSIELTDDGTLDTVLRCSACGEEFRYNYQSTDAPDEACAHGLTDGCRACYVAFVDESIQDATDDHECPTESTEPEDGDITLLTLTGGDR